MASKYRVFLVARKDVATKIDLSGPLEAPQGRTFQALARLIRNAFFRAILPGFHRQVGQAPPARRSSARATPPPRTP